MADKSISEKSEAAMKAVRATATMTGLAIAARRLIESPTSGYAVEEEMAVVAILEAIEGLSETVGGYLADQVGA